MKLQLPVWKNEVLTLKIEDLSYEGMGVAKVNDYPLFIDNALPEEIVKVKIIKTNKNFGYARVLMYFSNSIDRVKNSKNLRNDIVPLAHLKYKKQLIFKRNQIVNVFNKQHLNINVKETVGMLNPYFYRNKAQLPVRKIKGKLYIGFYNKHSHDLVPQCDSIIQSKIINVAARKILNIFRKFKLDPYDEKTNKGMLRNVMFRYGFYSHELMIILITRNSDIPNVHNLINKIKEEIPQVTSIIQNINSKKTNVILGNKNKILYGKYYLSDKLLNNEFNISPNSFYQINPMQTEKLYSLVLQAADLKGNEIVIDAYCGIGTISISLAPKAKKVFGVELVKQSIKDAYKNANLNNINNVVFKAGKAEEIMPMWYKQGIRPDVIVVDPPRKGLDKSFIKSSVLMNPEKIIYVSCNPATLSRDISYFQDNKYYAEYTIPVDMFPMTTHVESVTLLKKK